MFYINIFTWNVTHFIMQRSAYYPIDIFSQPSRFLEIWYSDKL